MIKRIHLNNFRNHSRIDIDVSSDIVVLYGKNGEGKTNILEAISVFTGQRGLRRAKNEEMINKTTGKQFWNVIIETDDTSFAAGYVIDGRSGKKVYRVSDKISKNLAEFGMRNYILWMTYETDRLFLQGPANRRDFIDMFCCALSQKHSEHMANYDKLQKDRSAALKIFYENGEKEEDSKWLDIIEDKIVDFGLEVAKTRIETTRYLESGQIDDSLLPKFQNKMTGSLETEIFENIPVHLWYDKYRDELKERRYKDYVTKSTTFGPNRSDWSVFHVKKNMPASLCSAGEQKMLLSGVFLSYIMKSIKTDKRNLILLLDDVIAHLDSVHRDLLFSYIRNLVAENKGKVEVWLSGTDRFLFDELNSSALFLNVRNGDIERV